ncbi:hypothetical protein C2S51_001119 [Perilla frutescens var. frutescens]|nr:hypothetical protein C2S51_001119 [Perilla frutescens var. frutescens]
MTKKNQQFSWRIARDEELGFTVNTGQNSQIESSAAGEERKNTSPPADQLHTPMIPRLNASRVDGLSSGHTQSEVSNNPMLANDVLYIHQSEHPGMLLTTDIFDDRNFHNWCRAVKCGLLSRNKLGLIDGSVCKPAKNSVDYMQWVCVDFLVFN